MTKIQHGSPRSGPQPLPELRDAAIVPELHERLLGWYAARRRDLPWRRTRDPYAIWVSEVMLQQTRVETVIPYYERFLTRFPTATALAEAPVDDVLATWSGLGYYRRARLLLRGAQAVAARGGGLPRDREGLLGVPGMGPYTAGAVASIAFGEAVGLVDGNVARVLARIFALDDDMRGRGMKGARALADAIVHPEDPGGWNQSLMELGATVCTARSPACDACPARGVCRARAEGRQASLPVVSPKPKPREGRVQSVVATLRGRVLLARRAGERLFGGLWEPPSAEGTAEARASLVAKLPLASGLVEAGAVVHVLSHRRLTIDVLRAELARAPRTSAVLDGYDALRLVDPADLSTLGVSSLARKILARAAPRE